MKTNKRLFIIYYDRAQPKSRRKGFGATVNIYFLAHWRLAQRPQENGLNDALVHGTKAPSKWTTCRIGTRQKTP